MVLGLERLGQPIPIDTPHAVSVTLPTWKSNVGYEEGEEWVVSKMVTGYPRFFVHKSIQAFAAMLASQHGQAGDKAILLPGAKSAARCSAFFETYKPANATRLPSVLNLVPRVPNSNPAINRLLNVSAVLYPEQYAPVAKAFWQHTGEGISSRRAEYLRTMFEEGALVDQSQLEFEQRQCKGPKRYRRAESLQNVFSNGNGNGHAAEVSDQLRFVEERFGRNLNLELSDKAKLALRRRIAGSLTLDAELEDAVNASVDETHRRDVSDFSHDDVYLYPGGMNAIYNTHRMMLQARGQLKSICFGFPYVDTLKVLEKFGPGCLFYGNGSEADLDDLETRLASGEKYLALFCEFPSNPLLRSVNLTRIRSLADKYDFGVVVDETIGNFLNVDVLPFVDVMVSSLTKIFSGDSNVMGGSAILNPQSRYFSILKPTYESKYEDNYWPEDALTMERNSRDFVSRIARVNDNAEAICEVLAAHPQIKTVYYPKVSPTRENYDRCRTKNGGYGGLLSATFHSMEDATAFYDALDVEKGPSLGTNFTLASPFVILAHYTELDWAAQYGVEANLVRFSVGLEEREVLVRHFRAALDAMGK